MKHPILSFFVLIFTWASEDFTFLNSAIAFMNDLPMEQREKAYVIVLQNGRGFYSVIYPKFSEKP